jgi:hypothetical protein
MKIALTVVSILLILMGAVWFLQGINILPGSYMSGDVRWSINGGIILLIGVGLLLYIYDRNTTIGGRK